jgi:hypothetical protein
VPDIETGGNCNYTPAIDGTESAQATSFRVFDNSAWTGATGDHWIQYVVRFPTGLTSTLNHFKARNGAADADSPFMFYVQETGNDYKLQLHCDNTYVSTTRVLSSGTFTAGNEYLVKFRWTSTDGTCELFVCPFTGDPYASCTTSQGTANGADAQSAFDGWWIDDSSQSVVDNIFFSTRNPSP